MASQHDPIIRQTFSGRYWTWECTCGYDRNAGLFYPDAAKANKAHRGHARRASKRAFDRAMSSAITNLEYPASEPRA